MVDQIEVYCDDPCHARGKVSKIAAFHHDPQAGRWDVDAGGEYGIYDDPAREDYRYQWRCKLCGATLPCTHEGLQWLANTVAAQGISRISLRHLLLVASNKPTQP